MKKGRFSEEQIIGILKQQEVGRKVADLAREHGIRYLLTGDNQATEHGLPRAWHWPKYDWTNIQAIHEALQNPSALHSPWQ